MKLPLLSGYTFAPATRSIDFSATGGFDVRRLYAVINLASNVLIYAAGKRGYGYASASGAVLTLEYDTETMGASDALFVLYEDGASATNGKLEELRALLAGTLQVSASSLPLPAGAAADATLQLILTALRAQRVETIWTDDTGVRFIRVDIGGTIVWTDVAGNATSAPGAGARPDSDSGTVVSRSTYRATASAAGFAIGDVLDHIVVTDGDAGDLVSNFWVNVTAGTKIAAPSASAITPQSPLADGASTAAKQDTGNASLASVDAKLPTLGRKPMAASVPVVVASDQAPLSVSLDGYTVSLPVTAAQLPATLGQKASAQSVSVALSSDGSVGAPADAAATSDAGTFSLLAFVKRGLANWTTLLARIPTSGQKAMANSLPVAIASDQGQVPISVVGFTVQLPTAVNSLPSVGASPETAQVSVPAGATPAAILATGRSDLQTIIKNTGTVKAYIGGSTVAPENGFPLAPGEQIVMDTKIALGAISAILDTSQTTAGQISVFRF